MTWRFPGARSPWPGNLFVVPVLVSGDRELKRVRFSITQHKSVTAALNTASSVRRFAEVAHQDVDTTTAKRPCGPVMFKRAQSLPSPSSRGNGHVSTDLHFGWQLPHQVIHFSWNCLTLVIDGTMLRWRPQSMTSWGRDRKESRPTC